MKRFRNALVVIDPSATGGRGVQRAKDLAVANGAKVKLCSVLEPLPGYIKGVLPGGGEAVEEQGRADAVAELTRLAAEFGEANIEVSTAVRVGDVAIECIREVLQHSHDVVIKDVESESGAIGGSDMRLLRKCPCPVWLVPGHEQAGLGCLLAAVDASFSDAEEEELSRDILRLATSLAEREGADLHVVHAWTEPGASYLARRMSLDEFDRFVREARERHRERFDDLLHEFGLAVADPNVHLDAGEPETVIPACASKYGAQLIVMGTVARGGLSGLLMGNTAERVLRNVRCGVLAVKPKNFVSPIRVD